MLEQNPLSPVIDNYGNQRFKNGLTYGIIIGLTIGFVIGYIKK